LKLYALIFHLIYYGAFSLSKFNSLKSNINIVNRSTLCGNERTNLYFDHSNRSILSGIERVLVKSIKHSWQKTSKHTHSYRLTLSRIDQCFLESINAFSNRIDHQSTPDSSPVARVGSWEWVRFLSDWEILYSRWRPYIMADAISKERKLGQKRLKGVSWSVFGA
jgi:hypothetical protein